MQSKKLAKNFSDLVIEDPKLLSEMKRFIEMIDLFEKKPELFKKMRAMVKGEM